jgi:hypothetical protein
MTLIHEDPLDTSDIINMMTTLRDNQSPSMVEDARVLQVMDSFQRYFDIHNDPPEYGLPDTIDEAVAASIMWDTQHA